jgi:hypothetical protein
LVVVLGAVIAEDGVRDVRLEDFGGPAFPLGQEDGECFMAAVEAMATEEFGGGWGGTGTGVEEGD